MKYLPTFLLVLGLLLSACNKDPIEKSDNFLQEEKAQLESTLKSDLAMASDCPVLVEDLTGEGCEGVIKKLKFRASGTITFEDPPQACVLAGGARLVVVEGTGNMTHLGRVTVRLTFCQGGMFPDVYPLSFPRGTVTAANGDQLNVEYTAPLPPDPNPIGWQHYTVTGGTGRFENACGYWDFCGGVDYVNGTFSHEGQGEIRY